MLKLMAFWVVIVPLPLAFIVPLRGGAPLYLLLFGWAMIFAKVAHDLITLISRCSVTLGRCFRGSETGAVTPNAAVKVTPRMFRITATVCVAFALAIFTQRENQRLRMSWLNVGAKASHVIQTFSSLGLRPMHDSRILLLLDNKLFSNKWQALFLASLVWNDHSLRMWVQTAGERTPQDVDYVISLGEFKARILRSPDHTDLASSWTATPE